MLYKSGFTLLKQVLFRSETAGGGERNRTLQTPGGGNASSCWCYLLEKHQRRRRRKRKEQLAILEQLLWQQSSSSSSSVVVAVMAFLCRSAASLLKPCRAAPAVLSAARLYSSGVCFKPVRVSLMEPYEQLACHNVKRHASLSVRRRCSRHTVANLFCPGVYLCLVLIIPLNVWVLNFNGG